jgi:hypothetical protein
MPLILLCLFVWSCDEAKDGLSILDKGTFAEYVRS